MTMLGSGLQTATRESNGNATMLDPMTSQEDGVLPRATPVVPSLFGNAIVPLRVPSVFCQIKKGIILLRNTLEPQWPSVFFVSPT